MSLLRTIGAGAAIALLSGSASGFTVSIINNTTVPDTSFRLVSSAPFDGQKLAAAPSIILTFSQTPRGERSTIKVVDMYGTRVDDGEVHVDNTNLTAVLPELAPGKYAVKWSAHCRCASDSELTDSFHFTIVPK